LNFCSAFYAALICLKFCPTLAVCGRDFDVEAPQDRVLSDVEFVAIVALKAAQATIVATRCNFKHLLLFLIGKYTLPSCLNLI
jgi:hypothetical protein